MFTLRPEVFTLLRDATARDALQAERTPVFAVRAGHEWRALVPNAASAEGKARWRLFIAQQPIALSEALRALEAARLAFATAFDGESTLIFVHADEVERALMVLTRAGFAVQAPNDALVPIHCSWRLPEGGRANATYLAETITYDVTHDRWLMRLVDVQVAPDVPEATRALIAEKVGRWVWVPSEARQGLALPLKYETLTGRVRWFYAQDPRAGS